MLFLRIGLLTCAFYAALTLVLEAGVWALVKFKGLSFFIDEKHPALSLGIVPGIVFGFLWLVSFSVALLIVYHDLKSIYPFLAN